MLAGGVPFIVSSTSVCNVWAMESISSTSDSVSSSLGLGVGPRSRTIPEERVGPGPTPASNQSKVIPVTPRSTATRMMAAAPSTGILPRFDHPFTASSVTPVNLAKRSSVNGLSAHGLSAWRTASSRDLIVPNGRSRSPLTGVRLSPRLGLRRP